MSDFEEKTEMETPKNEENKSDDDTKICVTKEQVAGILENIGIFSQLDYACIEFARATSRKSLKIDNEYLHFLLHTFTTQECLEEDVPFPTAIFVKPVYKEAEITHYDLICLQKSEKFNKSKLSSFENYCKFHRHHFKCDTSDEEIFFSFKNSLLRNEGLFINNNEKGSGMLKLVWISRKAIIVFLFREEMDETKKVCEVFSPFVSNDKMIHQYNINETEIFELPINYQDISKINNE